MPKHPVGKGMFIWNIPNCANGNPYAIAAKAQEAKISWVTIKVQDKHFEYYSEAVTMPVVSALEAVNIKVYGWGYLVGKDVIRGTTPQKEAEKTISLILKYRLQGFFMDAEAEYKRSGMNTSATIYTTAVRSALPTTELGLCSYRFPSLHPQLPWNEFLRHADFHVPQVYWEQAHNSATQLRQSHMQLSSLKAIPVIPVGSCYSRGAPGKTDYWEPTIQDLDAFDATAKALSLPGLSWWSWEHAERRQDWWSTISKHSWSTSPPPPPPPPPTPPAPPAPVLTDKQKLEILWREATKAKWNMNF